jgi:hypothetical protein
VAAGSVSIEVTDRRQELYSFRGRVASAMMRSYSARLISRRVDTFALAILPVWAQRRQVHLLMWPADRASSCSTLNHSWRDWAGGEASSGISLPKPRIFFWGNQVAVPWIHASNFVPLCKAGPTRPAADRGLCRPMPKI